MDNLAGLSDDYTCPSFESLSDSAKKAKRSRKAKSTEGPGAEGGEPKKSKQGGKRQKKANTTQYVYRYGARQPVTNLDMVNEQLLQAHHYRNATVEYERKRREETAAALRALPSAARLRKLDHSIKCRQKLVNKLRDRKKVFHMEKRDRAARWPKIEEKINRRVSELKRLWVERHDVCAELYKTEEWKAGEQARNDSFNAEQRRMYGSFPTITMNGTRGRIKRDARRLGKGRPPHFKRWDGQEALCLQFSKGLAVDKALSGEHKWLRIERVDGAIWEPGSAKSRGKPPVNIDEVKHPQNVKLDADGYAMRKLGNAWVHLRIGTNKIKDASKPKKDGTPRTVYEPIWTKVPINFHRELPSHAQIKEVLLQRVKIGTDARWFFHCILEEDLAQRVQNPALATSGYVSVDVGWRLVPCNGSPCGFRSKEHDHLVHGDKCPKKAVRVAYWAGSDGEKGEVRLSARMVCAYYKSQDIQSIRDGKFNDIRAMLRSWINENSIADLWLREKTTGMHLWHDPVRLVKIILHWRDNRLPGDEAIFSLLESWRKTDKHLLNYGRRLSEQVQNQRKDIYRNLVATLSKKYATVVLEDIALNELAERKKPEEAHLEVEAARRYRTIAAISILRSCFQEKMRVITVEAAGTSYMCSNCNTAAFVGSSALEHTCSFCGKTWDRDYNAAINILVRGMKQDAEEQTKAAEVKPKTKSKPKPKAKPKSDASE